MPAKTKSRPVIEPELLLAIRDYLRAVGESESSFGRRVAGDPGLITDLRNGRSPGRILREKIEAALQTTIGSPAE